MTIKLFKPLVCADPEACVLEAYRHALFGGQSFIMRSLAGVSMGHLIDGDVLRLNMTAQRLIRGKFRLIPQIGGLYRLDLTGEAFELIIREVDG